MTEHMFFTLVFSVFGLFMGSFYNVVGLRIPQSESIVFPGSHCTSCNRQLKWYELVPVLSFIFLRGKCRTCKEKVSYLYPLMELLTGVLFGLVIYEFGLSIDSLFYLLLVSLMVIITVSDLTTYLIPNKILLVFSVLMLPFITFLDTLTWKEAFLGFALSFVLNMVIILLSRGKGMGGGDIKLFLLLGLLLGWKKFLVMFFLAVVIGLVVGIILRFVKKMKEFPFGPSIAIATILVLFYGDFLFDWYMNMLI